jgi:two-component system, cell cycle sensor histidine kinase and response regulator CckA
LSAQQKSLISNFIASERDFGLRLNTAVSLDQWLKICLEYMMQISESDTAGIYLKDNFDGSMKLAVHRNLSERFLEIVSEFTPESRPYQLISKGDPFYVSWQDMQIPERKYMVVEGFKSYAVLPVRFKEEMIACVNVVSKQRMQVPDFTRAALETAISRLGPLIAKARTDETIRRNQANLKRVFNSTKDYLVVSNEKGKVLYINNACRDDLGYKAEVLHDTLFLNLYEPGMAEQLSSFLISDWNEDGFSCEGTILTADDRPIPVDIRIVR